MAQGKLHDAKDAIHLAFAPGTVPSLEWLPDMLVARGDLRMSDHDHAGAEADFRRSLAMRHRRGMPYYELEARLGLTELHVREKAPAAMPELDRVKHDADELGYGIFAIKINAFMRSVHLRHKPAFRFSASGESAILLIDAVVDFGHSQWNGKRTGACSRRSQ